MYHYILMMKISSTLNEIEGQKSAFQEALKP